MANPATLQAEAVFEILVRENADMLTTYLRSVVWRPGAIDDLFQETMLVAWKRLPEYDQKRPFGPWLRGIAARMVMAHSRKAKRDLLVCDERVLEHLDRQLQHIGQRSGDTWDDKLVALRECIAALPDDQQQTVRLRYLEDLQADRVASQLNVSLEAIKKRLQRARAQLLDCIRSKQLLPELNP
jgi:RNA polymerase sigma-70 factor (ECF subfamily)